MSAYNLNERTRHRLPRRIKVLILVLIALLLASLVAVRHIYYNSLGPVSNDQATQIVTITSGSSSKQIATQLENKRLIRSAWAFELYVHSKQVGDKLQAGTYALSPSQGTPSIISTISEGAVTSDLVTILPGRRLDQVEADLINAGFSPEAVKNALNPSLYADMPVMAYKPAEASLEGLLYPDSFQKTADTDPATIIRQSLQEMSDRLTTDVQQSFATHGLTVYEGIVLASMLEKEVSKSSDRAQAAQVFLKRQKMDMMLGSDVTAFYGAILAGKSPSVNYDSPYNTRIYKGLPPTPISSVSKNSLEAAGNPSNTDWLYFVAGDNGNTYFSNTLAEHEALTAKYCQKLCSE